MKTIRQVATEQRLSRITLQQAAKSGRLGQSASQSGATWLIDDEHEDWRAWLTAHWQQPRVKGKVIS